MKITDFALIFIGITLPIIIIIYINISYTIKAEEQEIYYKKIINQAVIDATKEMKEVESNDAEIDYGYSGVSDNKVSLNSQIAVNTFLNSLYNNFGIKGNKAAEQYLQLFIPAIAIIDYNGVQVSSIETFIKDGQQVTEHKLKPKRYYTYTYSIFLDGSIKEGIHLNSESIHTVEFTMDDYIVHRGSYKYLGSWQDIPLESFYITDENNNSNLVAGIYNSTSKTNIVNMLKNRRKEIIASNVTEEMAYAVNSNNSYARAAGITYNFVFPTTTQDEMYNSVEKVGIIAFVQGLSIGNKYLNTKAYAISKLDLATKFYFSIDSIDSKYKMNLYHKDENCPEYKISTHDDINPHFVSTKQQAASAKATIKDSAGKYQNIQGFYPCPICNP